MTGVFFVFPGAIEEIEVFAGAAAERPGVRRLALVLCGFWIVIFRIPFSRAEKREIEAELTRIRADMKAANDPRAVAPTAVMPDLERGKGAWTWVGFWMLVVAWVLATSAALTVRAWTLPSEQYGMLLFVAPGFGLLSGWLLYAASVNFGVAYQADSYPDGVRPVPTGGGTFAYRGSLWPVAVAAVAGLVALIGAEPAHPVPLVVALVFLRRGTGRTLRPSCWSLVGVLLGVVLVGGAFVANWKPAVVTHGVRRRACGAPPCGNRPHISDTSGDDRCRQRRRAASAGAARASAAAAAAAPALAARRGPAAAAAGVRGSQARRGHHHQRPLARSMAALELRAQRV